MEVIEQENLIFKTGDTGIILGKISDQEIHQHYAVQLTISIYEDFELYDESKTYISDALVTQPQVAHRLNSNGLPVLVLLLNPGTAVGHFIGKHMTTKPVEGFKEEWVDYLRMFAKDLLKNEINEKTFLSACINSMAEFGDRCLLAKHKIDKRILASLQYMDRHRREIVSLEEISEEMCLSESRFQHLFKEETGISFRRMQLWKRLIGSFDLLSESKTLTALAHKSGFSDSSHYSKTFKESFGMTPSEVFGTSHLRMD